MRAHPFELISPISDGICPSSRLCARLSTSMFMICPNCAGSEPSSLLTDASNQVRLFSSPTSVLHTAAGSE